MSISSIFELIYDWFQFETGLATPPYSEGKMYWDDVDKTVAVMTDLPEVTLKLGQEEHMRVANSTGSTLLKGEVVTSAGTVDLNNVPNVVKSISNPVQESLNAIAVITDDLIDGNEGIATTFGRLTGLDTSLFNVGDPLYLSGSVSGFIVNQKPLSPYLTIRVGYCLKSDPTDGIIFVSIDISNSTACTFDGTASEQIKLETLIESGVIYAEVSTVDGVDNATFLLSQDFWILNTTTGPGTGGSARVALTPGLSEAALQVNYIYAEKTGTENVAQLSASTSLPTGEFSWIGQISIQDTTSFIANGPMSHQRFDDSLCHDGRGMLSHHSEKLRSIGAQYESGVQPSVLGLPADVQLDTTIGTIYQLERYEFPAFTTGHDYYVTNDPSAPYVKINNLNVLLTDAQNGTMVNRYYSLIIWGATDNNLDDKMFVNLPIGSYTTASQAIADSSQFAVTTIPKLFSKNSFLICRLVLRHSASGGGSWTNVAADELGVDFIDLRGVLPGFNSSGAGISTSPEFSDGVFRIFDEIDVTKKLAFQVDNVSTSTVRVMTVPDNNGVMATTNNVLGTAGNILATPNGDTVVIDLDPSQLTSTFLELTDTPSNYANSLSLYRVNSAQTAVEESLVTLTDSTNLFIIQKGTTSLTVLADLSVTGTSLINQDVTTTASPTFVGATLSGITEGSLLFAGSGGLVSQDNTNLFWDDSIDRLGIGVNTFSHTNPGLHIIGDIELDHTALEADGHALELIVDTGGFGDVKAIDIDYITNTIGTAQEEGIILINIDESASTGGEVFGLEILTTTLGSADIIALKTGIGIDPIGQFVGTFGDPASFLVKAVDQLAAISDGGAGNITFFVAVSDTITIGLATKFEEIEILIETGASGAGISPKFEFSTGIGTWSEFTPTDGTNGFRNTGVILFDDATVPSWATGTGTEFLIRITRERNSLSTVPIVDEVQVSAVTVFKWDKNADIIANNITTVTQSPGDNSTFAATTAYVESAITASNQTTSGTANRIQVTNGSTNPIIDISSSYVGQTSITTLGTIGTGIWNAGAITSSGALSINGTGDSYFTGKVGIGTVVPAAKLHCTQSSSTNTDLIIFENPSATTNKRSYRFNNYGGDDRLLIQSLDNSYAYVRNIVSFYHDGNTDFWGDVTASNLSGTNTGDQTITLSGDVSGSGTGAITTTIGALKVTNAMLAGSIEASKLIGTDIATVGTITTGIWNAGAITSSGDVNLIGSNQIIFTNTDTTNNLKLELWGGYGLGINAATLFYAANGFHDFRDASGVNTRMRLTTAASGGLSVFGTGNSYFTGNLGVGIATPNTEFNVLGDILSSASPGGNDGIRLIPQYDGLGAGGRIYFDEISTNELFGFSVGFNGGVANAILDWSDNTFVLARHDNNLTGVQVMTIARSGGTNFYEDVAFDTNTLFVDSSANSVGVGTVTPVSKLDIQVAARTGSHGNISDTALYSTATSGEGSYLDGIAEFRHSNGLQGIGFGYNTIYATGSTPAQNIKLQSRGTGSILLQNDSLTDLLVVASTGEITAPLNPKFSAYNSLSDSDVTGDGTIYTVIFDTELYDIGSNYNTTTGVFTAPETGFYYFEAGVLWRDLDSVSSVTGDIYLVTTARNFNLERINPQYYATSTAGFLKGGENSKLVEMAAGDTAHITVQVTGSTKTVDIFGGGAAVMWTSFSGYLAN